jgi:hypothetical protein
MPSGLMRYTGTPIFTLSTGRTTTGAGSWMPLGAAYRSWALQCIRTTTGTTAFTVVLQGTLSTATTNPRTIVSYTRSGDNSSVKVTTGVVPVGLVRYSVTALGGTSGPIGFGVRIYATAVP